jgi:hypothetical protein
VVPLIFQSAICAMHCIFILFRNTRSNLAFRCTVTRTPVAAAAERKGGREEGARA